MTNRSIRIASILRALILSLSCAAPAHAQVAGAAPAAACELVSTDAAIDYGRLGPYDLPIPPPGATELSLGKRVLTLHATCGTPRRMTLFYHGRTQGNGTFRFDSRGPTSNGGRLVVRVLKAQLDGRPAALGRTRTPSIPAQALEPSTELSPGWGVTTGSVGRQLSLQIELEAIVPRSAMRPRTDETWQSMGQFMLESI